MQGQEIKLNWQDEKYDNLDKIRGSLLELVGDQCFWNLKLYVHRLRGKPEEMEQHGWYLSSYRMYLVDEKLQAADLEDAKREASKLALEWLGKISRDVNDVFRALNQGQGGWYVIKGEINSSGWLEPYPGELPIEVNTGDVITFLAEMIKRNNMILDGTFEDIWKEAGATDGEEKAEKEE